MVFEILGMSLTELLRNNHFRGFPLHLVKKVAREALQGISYLHSLDMVHTDIKPDNILVAHKDIKEILVRQLAKEEEIKEAERKKEVNAAAALKMHHHAKTPVENTARGVIRSNAEDPTNKSRTSIAGSRWDVTDRTVYVFPSEPINFDAELLAEHDTSGTGRNGKAFGIPWLQGRNIDEFGSVPGDAQLSSKWRKLNDPFELATAPSTPPMASRYSSSHPNPIQPLDAPSGPCALAGSPENITSFGGMPFEVPPTASTSSSEDFKASSMPNISAGPSLRDLSTFQFADQASVAHLLPRTRPTHAANTELDDDLDDNILTMVKRSSRSRSRSTTGKRSASTSPAVNLRKTFEQMSLGMADFQREEEPAAQSTSSSADSGVSGHAYFPRAAATERSQSQASSVQSSGTQLTRSCSTSSSKTNTSESSVSGFHGSDVPVSRAPASTTGGSVQSFNTLSSQDCFRPELVNIQMNLVDTTFPTESPPRTDSDSSYNDSSPQGSSQELSPFSTASTDWTASTSTRRNLDSISFKVADLGNALFFSQAKSFKCLPDVIATRQYRPPEVIIKAPWDASADIWSLACVVSATPPFA